MNERFFIRHQDRALWHEVHQEIYCAFFAGQMGHPAGRLKTNFGTTSRWEGRIVVSDLELNELELSGVLGLSYETFLRSPFRGPA